MMHQQYSLSTNCTVSYTSEVNTQMNLISFRRQEEAYLLEQLSQLKNCQEYPKTRISNRSTDLDFTLTEGTTK